MDSATTDILVNCVASPEIDVENGLQSLVLQQWTDSTADAQYDTTIWSRMLAKLPHVESFTLSAITLSTSLFDDMMTFTNDIITQSDKLTSLELTDSDLTSAQTEAILYSFNTIAAQSTPVMTIQTLTLQYADFST